MNYRPTQRDLAESARRRSAQQAHDTNWLLQQDNRPTAEELERLRQRNPRLWSKYQDKSHAMKTVKIHFRSFSDKIAFNQRNGIMPAELLADGPGWQTMEDDGTAYENSPYVYHVER